MGNPNRRGIFPAHTTEANSSESILREIEERVSRCGNVDQILSCLDMMAGVYKGNVGLRQKFESLGKSRINDIMIKGNMTYKEYQDAMLKFNQALSGKKS